MEKPRMFPCCGSQSWRSVGGQLSKKAVNGVHACYLGYVFGDRTVDGWDCVWEPCILAWVYMLYLLGLADLRITN